MEPAAYRPPDKLVVRGMPFLLSGWNGEYTIQQQEHNERPVWHRAAHRKLGIPIIGVYIWWAVDRNSWILHRECDDEDEAALESLHADAMPMGKWMNSVQVTAAPSAQPPTPSDALKGAAFVNRIMFPAPQPGYSANSFPGQLAWIPRFGPFGDGTGTVPALILPNPQAWCLILYCHGNGTDLGWEGELGEDIAFMQALGHNCGAHVVAVEYPGYGCSTTGGTPSEHSLNRDVEIAFNFITSPLGAHWPPERVIVFGRSIGTGPATWLAARRALGGCVLVSPYTSMRGMVAAIAGSHLSWAISDRFKSTEEVQCANFPDLLVFHGTDDKLIPFEHGKAVVHAATDNGSLAERRLVALHGYGHNDLFDDWNHRIMCSEFSKTFAPRLQSDGLDLHVPPEVFSTPSSAEAATSRGSLLSRVLAASVAVSAQSVETSAATLTSGRF